MTLLASCPLSRPNSSPSFKRLADIGVCDTTVSNYEISPSILDIKPELTPF